MSRKNNKEKKIHLFEEVLQLLKDVKKPLNYKQISARLGVEDPAQRTLVSFLLRDMEKKKVIREAGKGQYVHAGFRPRATEQPQKRSSGTGNFIEGTVDMTASGSAYVEAEGMEQDIYIAQRNTLNAMDKDKVKVRLIQDRRGKKPEGVIEEIVQRAKSQFVGTVQISKDFAFLNPDSPKIPFDIHIPLDKLKGAKNGQKALAKMIKWEAGRKNPQGEILQVLGDAGLHNTEIHAILAEFGLPNDFPESVEKEADQIPTEITKDEIASRRDFRKITTFTIDPVDAKDFDDAISVRKLQNGRWEIGVHIADVTHYVKENTQLDKEGYLRATSVYLVDRVVPMLPENISNVLCSLRPKEEKLCFSAVFEMDENAQVLNKWFGRTVIYSDRRFTYEEAQDIIETGKGDLSEEILLLDRLAKKLRAERFKRGSIAFDKLEVKFHLDEAGNPTGVFFKAMKDSNKLIEDFMLLANKEVALFCSPKEKGDKGQGASAPFVYRVHDKPDGEKLKAFAEIAARFGYKINLKNELTIAETMNRTLKECSGKPEANMIEMLAIRSMAKAIYTTKNIGHYGLGFSHYTHFTSPIRRYPDMMVHRLLAQKLQGANNRSQFNTGILDDQCKHSSEREKLAAEAERASTKYKQVQYLSEKIGQEFEGMISGVTEWGIFVELTESHCEGLVRMKEVRTDRYYFDEKNFCYIGSRSKRKLSLGDKIQVKVQKADMIKKQLDFGLVD
jgi:ribonuclease R